METAMTAAITERDEATGTTPHGYHHTRTVEIAGHTVRAHVERDYYLNQSRAVAEVLNDQMTWTSLAADAPSDWWHNTPTPGPDIHDPTRFLSPVTNASSSAPPRSSPHHRPPTPSPRTCTARSARYSRPATATTPNTASNPTTSPGPTPGAARCTSSSTPRRQRHLHQAPPQRLPVRRQQRRSGLRHP
jgi:hypothetical protein